MALQLAAQRNDIRSVIARHSHFRWVTGSTLFLILVQLPFISINRYVFPVMPFFMFGTGYLVKEFVTWIRRAFVVSEA
ncbi:hypothetical protein [Alicyclobacillus fastidiosus]|uniref:hypothetical protein n=1 Tax=Alicyclobacillus fastidiosus TaxID=392011 RepID=UPI0023EA034B|nr:hypothetical protein [Alicyclobacillus fastidiosus]GMA66074.1 hypothetical protein GCM10025859_65160 [Alicyclobacillus fastidiosus]